MLPQIFVSFIAYSVLEYVTVMGLVDNAIRIFFFNPHMSQDAKLRLMALEVFLIVVLALVFLLVFHHVPLVSCLMVWSCLSSTKHLWQVMVRRYWNDFVEFELNKQPVPVAPPMTSAAPVPTVDKDNRYMRNGMIDDNNLQQSHQHQHQHQHMVPAHTQMQHQHHPQQQQQVQSQPYLRSTPAQAFHFSGKLTKTLQSAMSSLRKVRKSPPGLTNNSKTNLCSVNVTLQVLANTPSLADLVVQNQLRVKKSAHIQEFMTELGNILVQLRRCTSATVSTQSLMGITSSLGPPQPQNDCVEWLMWFMEVVHSSYMPPAPSEVESGLQRYKLLRAVPLAQPLLILYETSQLPAALARMKTECLEKIDQAHGLKSSTYSEPIQRLTEVEWLSHKLTNHSVIDDLFTGQVVEANHCKSCHHISVTVQPFKVLPLPIIAPKYTDQSVSLVDCLTKFSELEKLYGANGLHCKYCNLRNPSYSGSDHHKPQNFFKRTALDSGVGGDSPLFGRPSTTDMSTDFLSPIRPSHDDHNMDHSLFLEMQGKTSTPVAQQSLARHRANKASFASPILARPRATSSPLQTSRHLSDGERQILLSQLPDFLILQLMRLTYKDGKMEKVKTPVSIPLMNLDSSHLVTEMLLGGDHKSSINGCYKYCLYSMVVHLGENSVVRGHYMVYTQSEDGSWFCCNDSKVTPVNMDYEIQTRQVRENAYLLCYRKMKLL